MSLSQLVDHRLRDEADAILSPAELLCVLLGVFSDDQTRWDFHTPVKDHVLEVGTASDLGIGQGDDAFEL